MTTTIELDAGTVARIDALVARTGRDRAEVVRLLVLNGIDDLEEAALADEVWRRIQRGEEKLHTSQDLRADLGLDD